MNYFVLFLNNLTQWNCHFADNDGALFSVFLISGFLGFKFQRNEFGFSGIEFE